jgi:hypothetical protein
MAKALIYNEKILVVVVVTMSYKIPIPTKGTQNEISSSLPASRSDGLRQA